MTTSSARVSKALSSMPIARLLDLTLEAISPSRTVISMPLTTQLTFDGRVCQGGIVATLADFAAVAAAYSAVAEEGTFVATTGIETHNLAPARGRRLVAVGRLISEPGRSMLAAADVHIESPDGQLCLSGLFTAARISVSA